MHIYTIIYLIGVCLNMLLFGIAIGTTNAKEESYVGAIILSFLSLPLTFLMFGLLIAPNKKQ